MDSEALKLGIPAAGLLSVGFWMAAFMSNSWQSSTVPVTVSESVAGSSSISESVPVSAGLGHIELKKLCPSEGSTMCSAKLEAYCSLVSSGCLIKHKTGVSLKQSVETGPQCGVFVDCGSDTGGMLDYLSLTTLSLGFVSSLATVIGSTLSSVRSFRSARLCFGVAASLGLLALGIFLSLKSRANVAVITSALKTSGMIGWLRESSAWSKPPAWTEEVLREQLNAFTSSSIPNGSVPPAKLSTGFYFCIVAVFSSLVPFALSILILMEIPDEEDLNVAKPRASVQRPSVGASVRLAAKKKILSASSSDSPSVVSVTSLEDGMDQVDTQPEHEVSNNQLSDFFNDIYSQAISEPSTVAHDHLPELSKEPSSPEPEYPQEPKAN